MNDKGRLYVIDKCIIDPEKNCLGLAEAAILKKRIDDLEEWRNKSSKFHEDFYDWQRTQIARDAKLDEQLKNMDNNISKMLEWQENQQLKPAKRWDSIIDKIMMLTIGGIVTYLLTQIGI